MSDVLYEPKIVIKVEDGELSKLKAAEAQAKDTGKAMQEAVGGTSPFGGRLRTLHDELGKVHTRFGDALKSVSGVSSALTGGVAQAAKLAGVAGGVATAFLAAREAVYRISDGITGTSDQIRNMADGIKRAEEHAARMAGHFKASASFRQALSEANTQFRNQAMLSGVPEFMKPQASIGAALREASEQSKSARMTMIFNRDESIREAQGKEVLTFDEWRKREAVGYWGKAKDLFKSDGTIERWFPSVGNAYRQDYANYARSASRDAARPIRMMYERDKKALEDSERERGKMFESTLHAAIRQRNRSTMFANVMSQFDLHRQQQVAGHDMLGASMTDVFKSTTGNVLGSLGQGHFREAWNAAKTGFSKAAITYRDYRFGENQEMMGLRSGQRIAELTAKNSLFGENNLAIEMERINAQLRPAMDMQRKIIAEASEGIAKEYAKQKLSALDATKAMMEAEARKQEAIRQVHLAMGATFATWEAGTMTNGYGNLSVMNPTSGLYESSGPLTNDQSESYRRQMMGYQAQLVRNTSPRRGDARDRRY